MRFLFACLCSARCMGIAMECTLKHEQCTPYTAGAGGCPVDWTKRAIAAFREQLCGKSLFCREGMAELGRLVQDISEGKAKSEDLELIRELCGAIVQAADCDGAKDVAANIMNALRDDAEVWDAHIRRKRCSALACDGLLNFYIDAAKCTACKACAGACPADAIMGGEGLYHVIESDSCEKCGECVRVCKSGAASKAMAGAVLPKLPEEPGAVGSFKGGGLGGLRRGLRGAAR